MASIYIYICHLNFDKKSSQDSPQPPAPGFWDSTVPSARPSTELCFGILAASQRTRGTLMLLPGVNKDHWKILEQWLKHIYSSHCPISEEYSCNKGFRTWLKVISPRYKPSLRFHRIQILCSIPGDILMAVPTRNNQIVCDHAWYRDSGFKSHELLDHSAKLNKHQRTLLEKQWVLDTIDTHVTNMV